ncbi:MAG: hypothetical protein NVS9B8_07160 [Candidatus Limnocylindrales bacterium]
MPPADDGRLGDVGGEAGWLAGALAASAEDGDPLSAGFVSLAVDSLPPDPPSAAVGAVGVVEGLVERDAALRSFLAQPEPLKWTDGAEKPFRTGPSWQTGQVVGPSALMPWIISNRVPHERHTYS